MSYQRSRVGSSNVIFHICKMGIILLISWGCGEGHMMCWLWDAKSEFRKRSLKVT